MKLPREIERKIGQWPLSYAARDNLYEIAAIVAEDCAAALQAVAKAAQISDSNEALFYAKAAQFIRNRYRLDEPTDEPCDVCGGTGMQKPPPTACYGVEFDSSGRPKPVRCWKCGGKEGVK